MRRASASTVLVILFFSIIFTVSPEVYAMSPNFKMGDAFIPQDVPRGHNSSIVPGYFETSEYLIGNVSVGIILLESNGTVDLSTEDWTSDEEMDVITEIETGLSWWARQNPAASVSFEYDVHYRVPTSYEPINHPAFPDQELWIGEAMTYIGYSNGFFFTQVRDYVNDLRDELNTNWAFTIFVVDSSNDPDGYFTGIQYGRTWFAYAYFGGPFFVMTYDNDAWGINDMDRVSAHEMGHIFYATDEYNGRTEYSGYLNVSDVEGSLCLMENNAWRLSSGTWGQVGWRDTDGDGIQEIVDTFPKVTVITNSSDVATDDVSVTYSGFVTEVPHPNHNPIGTGRDLTINTVADVELKHDLNAWFKATATDGSFDEAVETFSFTTRVSIGTHILDIRAKNSIENANKSRFFHVAGQVAVTTHVKISVDSWLDIVVDKTTFRVIATKPNIAKAVINISNNGPKFIGSLTIFYFLPSDWHLDPNVIQIRAIHGREKTVTIISNKYSVMAFESNLLMVAIPDIKAATGDYMKFGDEFTIVLKLEYVLKGSTLPDSYAWSDEGPIYHFAFATTPLKSKLKWVLGPPWVWKRP